MAPAAPASNPRSRGSALRLAGPSSSKRRTPVIKHPPYPEMIQKAIRDLAEEGGSTVAAIEELIRKAFPNGGLPRLHRTMFPYYLRKLILEGELRESRTGRILLNHAAGASIEKRSRARAAGSGTARSRRRAQDVDEVIEPKNLESVLEDMEVAAEAVAPPEQVVAVEGISDAVVLETVPKRRGRATSRKAPVPSENGDTNTMAPLEPKPSGRAAAKRKKAEVGRPETPKPPNQQAVEETAVTADDVDTVNDEAVKSEVPKPPKRQVRSRKQQNLAAAAEDTAVNLDDVKALKPEAPKPPKRQVRSRKQQNLSLAEDALVNVDDADAVNVEVAKEEARKPPKRQMRSRKPPPTAADVSNGDDLDAADPEAPKAPKRQVRSRKQHEQAAIEDAAAVAKALGVNSELAETEAPKPGKRPTRSRKEQTPTVEDITVAYESPAPLLQKARKSISSTRAKADECSPVPKRRGRGRAPTRKQVKEAEVTAVAHQNDCLPPSADANASSVNPADAKKRRPVAKGRKKAEAQAEQQEAAPASVNRDGDTTASGRNMGQSQPSRTVSNRLKEPTVDPVLPEKMIEEEAKATSGESVKAKPRRRNTKRAAAVSNVPKVDHVAVPATDVGEAEPEATREKSPSGPVVGRGGQRGRRGSKQIPEDTNAAATVRTRRGRMTSKS